MQSQLTQRNDEFRKVQQELESSRRALEKMEQASLEKHGDGEETAALHAELVAFREREKENEARHSKQEQELSALQHQLSESQSRACVADEAESRCKELQSKLDGLNAELKKKEDERRGLSERVHGED